MHTDHSYDCATPVEVLLAEARARGLGAIAITDHNEISGALDARAKADGIKVIVAEEVKTAEQGEVIGLFIEEKIPRGMTLEETIAEIKRQGGLVYVPHPFDRMHSVPGLREPARQSSTRSTRSRSSIPGSRSPSSTRRRFVSPPSTGFPRVQDRTHTFPRASARSGSGCVTSTAPRSSCESLRDADIIRNPASLLYVQALKFLQTKAHARRRARRASGTAACARARPASPDALARTSTRSRPIRGECRRPMTRSARNTSSARSAS